MLVWLSVWSKMQTCIWPSWCHFHSPSLASVKSRLVLPFWYRLTWVVPEKGPLNRRVYSLIHSFIEYAQCTNVQCNCTECLQQHSTLCVGEDSVQYVPPNHSYWSINTCIRQEPRPAYEDPYIDLSQCKHICGKGSLVWSEGNYWLIHWVVFYVPLDALSFQA